MSQASLELQVVKRDGRIVPFDIARIERAVERCFAECDDLSEGGTQPVHTPRGVAQYAKQQVGIWNECAGYPDRISVEQIQDLVEEALMRLGYPQPAKRYILYRAEHAKQRDERPIPEDVRTAFAESASYFPTPLQQFQFFDKYSRYNRDLGRRETWVETVDRSVDFLYELAGDHLPSETYQRIRSGILEMRVMPSMRLLAMAGAPARRNSMSIYNCSYMACSSLDCFPEALLISMAGCGVGYSVESKYVDQLPTIKAQGTHNSWAGIWVIEDSAEGWAEALSYGLGVWFSGEDIAFDYSAIRPAGSPLLTKGGRASGPEPLKKMLEFVRARILSRQGRKLRPIDVHDMMCMVGSAAVSGGVRRTAMISLFDEDDAEMRSAKRPGFESEHNYRWNANNSAVRSAASMSDQTEFVTGFMEMITSGNGEPGIFSREVANALRPKRRAEAEFGCNPCGEILLRSEQFCNLSAAVVRADDDFESLAEKVELATIIGTIQSLATTFPGLRPSWKANCEAERLLGVDITGQMDNPTLLTPNHFSALRSTANWHAARTAEKLGIVKPAAITCVKPSGNTSQLVDCASGLHARWAPFYIRNVRVSASSPLYRVLRDAGAPLAPENGDDPDNPRTYVCSFPVRAPSGARTRLSRSAVEQCEWWLRNKRYYTEHNPSVTITYRPDEVLELMTWVYEHRDMIGGMAFLPSFDAGYDQLPYIEIDEAEYERRAAAFPAIDFSKIWRYEQEDLSTASTTGACEGPVCLLNE